MDRQVSDEGTGKRMRWFNKGLVSGKIEDGDAFSMPYQRL